jgi:pimeloyl-ACP methyl ester carboxylesterase
MTLSPLLFLPGAGGDGAFWRPVGSLLPSRPATYLDWPGLGDQPRDEAVAGMDDLVRLAGSALDRPAVLVAQSMGGIVGVRLALERPQDVNALVLVATSGGIELELFGAEDWRPGYRARYPQTADWIFHPMPRLEAELDRLKIPVLLLWGEIDTISPPAVGNALLERLPGAHLVIISSGDHGMALEKPGPVAEAIGSFLKGEGL